MISDQENAIRWIFQCLELSVFIELFHHFTGFQTIKRHQFLNMVSVNFILFGVINVYPQVCPFHSLPLLKHVSTLARIGIGLVQSALRQQADPPSLQHLHRLLTEVRVLLG